MGKDLVEIGASLANFGLQEPQQMTFEDSEPQEEEQVAPEEESETDEEEQDASDEEVEEEDDEEAEEDGSLKEQLEHKEQVIRKFQSKVDSQEAQMNQMQQQLMAVYQEFQQYKNQEVEEDDDFDIDDDELVTGKDLKAAKKRSKKTSSEMEQLKQFEAQRAQQEQAKFQAQNQWLQSRPDINEVSKFIDENNLSSDPELSALQTDSIGLYWAVKAKMLEAKTKSFRKATKSVKKRKNVPPTGGKGGAGRGNSPAGQMERQMQALGQKLGIDLSAR